MTAWCNGAWVRSDTDGVGLVEAASRGIVALFAVVVAGVAVAVDRSTAVAVCSVTAALMGERGDGILASTVGVGNSPLGKIASPRTVVGSVVAVDRSTASLSLTVSLWWSAAAAAVGVAVLLGVAVDGPTASLVWSASAAGVGVAVDRSTAVLLGVAVDRSTAGVAALAACTDVAVNWLTAFIVAAFEWSKALVV